MLRTLAAWLAGALLWAGCSAAVIDFPSATPGAPRRITGSLLVPEGSGPFAAIVLMHPCHGVLPTTRRWAREFRDAGYVALIVDSWTPRGLTENCTPASVDLPNTERFDDAVGALRYLQARPFVDPARIGVIGWSAGGVYAMALVNGPSLDRARARGVVVPEPGFRAAVGLYPGGCFSLVRERAVRPLLVLMGDADDWTAPGPCVEMTRAMRERGAPVELVLYPGALHYFDVEEQPRAWLPDVENRNLPGGCCGATVGHDAAAAADAKRRIAHFFGYHLGRRPP
jgi:dienelactone hydrolase